MNNYICFDLETVRNERSEEYFSPDGPYRPRIGQNKQKSGESNAAYNDRQRNLKRKKDEPAEDYELRQRNLEPKAGESDEAWSLRRADIESEDRSDALLKAALNPIAGKVICIGFKLPGQDIMCLHGTDEAQVLGTWGNILKRFGDHTLIGKNSSTFDLPYLKTRYHAHGMGMPNALSKVPKFGVITDIDHFFGRYGVKSQNLGSIAFNMGMDGKLGAGTDVHDWYFNYVDEVHLPKWDLIIPYCKGDVAIVDASVRRENKKFTYDGEMVKPV